MFRSVRSVVLICQAVRSASCTTGVIDAAYSANAHVERADRSGKRRAQFGLGHGHLGELQRRLGALDIGRRHGQITLRHTGAQLVQIRLGLVNRSLGHVERAAALLAEQLVEPGLTAPYRGASRCQSIRICAGMQLVETRLSTDELLLGGLACGIRDNLRPLDGDFSTMHGRLAPHIGILVLLFLPVIQLELDALIGIFPHSAGCGIVRDYHLRLEVHIAIRAAMTFLRPIQQHGKRAVAEHLDGHTADAPRQPAAPMGCHRDQIDALLPRIVHNRASWLTGKEHPGAN
jgi:hypothetical protein